jgi:hypothetical protein
LIGHADWSTARVVLSLPGNDITAADHTALYPRRPPGQRNTTANSAEQAAQPAFRYTRKLAAYNDL